jgi:stage II sporulation protein GA (sporulation sigma-E factor processing peptidase)
MVIYIEYALLENFILDGILLLLTLRTVKIPIQIWKVILSACLGAVFAVVYPLLTLSTPLGSLLKITFGAFLCLLVMDRLKTRKQWEKYAFSCLCFFTYSFAFGGALTALSNATAQSRASFFFTISGFIILSVIAHYLLKKLYKKKIEYQYIYDCVLIIGKKAVKTRGFFDSGNAASKNGLPVCFVCMELAFTLWGETVIEGMQENQERLEIDTLGGKKILPLYLGELCFSDGVRDRRIRTYFAPSRNIVFREYQVLLNARIMDEE